MADNNYTEENIRSLDWKEHIRLRPWYVYRKAWRWPRRMMVFTF
jgi:hypothetical protein